MTSVERIDGQKVQDRDSDIDPEEPLHCERYPGIRDPDDIDHDEHDQSYEQICPRASSGDSDGLSSCELTRARAESSETVEDNLGVGGSEFLARKGMSQFMPENGSQEDRGHENKLPDSFRSSLLEIVHPEDETEEPEEGLDLDREPEEFELQHGGSYAREEAKEKKNGRPESGTAVS